MRALRRICAGVRRAAPTAGAALALGGSSRFVRCELDPLHDRIEGRNQSFQAEVPGQVSTMVEPRKAHVVRIVLTGGPCGGKSSCLEPIRKEATRAGFNMINCPEIATILFNAGYKFDLDHKYNFQLAVAKLQLQMERNVIRLAESTGQPTIVLLDRGMLDGRAFSTEEEWNRIMDDLQSEMPSRTNNNVIDESYCLRRYDAVIHLITSAELDEDGEPLRDAAGKAIYRYGTTVDDSGVVVHRMEKPEAARAQDSRIQRAWANHKRLFVVNNKAGGMEDKIRDVVEFVMEVAEQYHPQKIDNKVIRRRIRELSRQVERLEEAIARR